MAEIAGLDGRVLETEWPFLLDCCAPEGDSERQRRLQQRNPNWQLLFYLAEEHGVLSQLAVCVAKLEAGNVPAEILKNLQARYRAQLMFTLGMTSELFRLLELYRKADLETMMVKGPVLSVRAHGDPGLRQYVDLDLLVRHRDIENATILMEQAGYESDVAIEAIRAGKIPGEYLFRKPGTKLLVELHTEHTFRYFPKPLPLEKYFTNRTEVMVDGHGVPALSAEDEFVLICIHGAKHFWERLMWIADVAAMMKNARDLDWNKVRLSAKQVGAERMVNVAMRLSNDLLRAEIPEEMKALVANDKQAQRLSKEVQTWLPAAGFAPPSLPRRALFRVKMRGGLLAGLAYLFRLSVSPTEEDWVEGAEGKRSWIWDAASRPTRLIKKYGRDGRD